MVGFFFRNPLTCILLVVGALMNISSRINDAYTLYNAGLPHQVYEAIGAGIFFLTVIVLLYRWDKERESGGSRQGLMTTPTSASSAIDIAHAVKPVDSAGLHVGYDKNKKNIQFGFNLKNSSSQPLRYSVQSASSAIDGRTSMAQSFTNKGGVIAREGTTRFLCVPIPYSLTKKGAQATASIVYQYGPAGPDEPPLREATYRFDISVGPTGASTYLIAEENDAEI